MYELCTNVGSSILGGVIGDHDYYHTLEFSPSQSNKSMIFGYPVRFAVSPFQNQHDFFFIDKLETFVLFDLEFLQESLCRVLLR